MGKGGPNHNRLGPFFILKTVRSLMNNQTDYSPMNISNQEFLQAIFGDDFIWAHVTDFFHDPGKGFSEESRKAWLGNHYVNVELHDLANQYFTISLFKETEQGARRRKDLFQSTHCIVIDDVGEKIPIELVLDKPAPSWILETSPGSQQWGYILNDPCKDRATVENLLTGLVHTICPDGVDSGMLGVTRYVRLPEGYNTKKSKVALNNGQPFKCNLVIWQPEVKTSIQALAQAFDLDLTKISSYRQATDYEFLEDHYASKHPAWLRLSLKNILNEGHYDISCPWTDEHTDPSDDRATIFVQANGYISFKCHHGHCISRSGNDLLEYLSTHITDWNILYKEFKNELARLNPVKPSPIKFKERL